MAEIKLYNTQGTVQEMKSSTVALEKELQTLIENNMELFFGVWFLKTEFQINNGRMDSIGIDENYSPVIFEYKRSKNENVINQGLFYLDWLLDHKAEFKLLVMDKLGKDEADKIDWSYPQVICIANDFTKFDEHAVKQMQRNIKLVRYRKFDDLLMFEYLNTPSVKAITDTSNILQSGKKTTIKSFVQQFESASQNMKDLYETVRNHILSLGDDITENQLKLYAAFKKIRNIACVELYAASAKLIIRLQIDPDTVEEPMKSKKNISKNTIGIGHFGTGEAAFTITSPEEFELFKPYIEQAYNEN